jgi:hypothetical protein
VAVYKNLKGKGFRFVYPFDPRFRRTYVHPINLDIGNWMNEQLNNALVDYFKNSS